MVVEILGREFTGILIADGFLAYDPQALALRDEQPTLDPATFEARRQQLEATLDALLAEGRRFTDPDNARFAKRLRKQRRYLLRFLQVEGVEATNNRAERALRPAVIVRKTGGCNRTERGASTHAVLASLLQPLKQQGREVLDYLASILTAPAEPPKLLAAPVSTPRERVNDGR